VAQLEKVQYTAKAHTTGDRDRASHSSDGRLGVKLSSPGTLGTGTNPEVNHSPTAKLVLPRRRMNK
jgi:osmotically inducible protein OsmC